MMTNKPPGEESPTEEQIADLLGMIRPHPGLRFHQRMDEQPWNHESRGLLFGRLNPWKSAALIGLIVIIVLGISLLSPSVQAIAQRFAQFFISTERNQLTVEVPLADLQDPQARFSLSIDEAEDLAGFDARTPKTLPAGYTFAGAGFSSEREAIVLNYAPPSAGQVLRIFQRQVGLEFQEISASANVEIVSIGSSAGEYVSGAWLVSTTAPESNDPLITLNATWDSDAKIQLLRWQENGILYEIIFAGSNSQALGYLTKNDLIAMAESMY